MHLYTFLHFIPSFDIIISSPPFPLHSSHTLTAHVGHDPSEDRHQTVSRLPDRHHDGNKESDEAVSLP